MNTNTTAPPPEVAIGAPPSGTTLVRPLAFPIQEGMLWTAGLDENGRPTSDDLEWVWLRVTPYGHWYTSEDRAREVWLGDFTRCCGCGAVGEFTFELDEQRCDHPASHQTIASALLADMPRPGPAVMRDRTRALRFMTADGSWTATVDTTEEASA